MRTGGLWRSGFKVVGFCGIDFSVRSGGSGVDMHSRCEVVEDRELCQNGTQTELGT